jgi:phosphatidylglycerophosphate synthase
MDQGLSAIRSSSELAQCSQGEVRIMIPSLRKMHAIIKFSAIILALVAVTPAKAKDCLKSHYTVLHGAAAGCIIGGHVAKKRAQMEREKREHPTPQNGEK